mgnify:CR=1 FL=1
MEHFGQRLGSGRSFYFDTQIEFRNIVLFCAKENKYIMLFGVHIQFQDMHFFNKIKETNIIQIQRVRNCDKSIRYALMVLEFNFFMVSHVLRYSDIKFDN